MEDDPGRKSGGLEDSDAFSRGSEGVVDGPTYTALLYRASDLVH